MIFEKELAKFKTLKSEKAAQLTKKKAMESYLQAFIESPEHLDDWSE